MGDSAALRGACAPLFILLSLHLGTPPARAAGPEAAARIERLEALLPALSAALGVPVLSDLPADTPLLLPAGAERSAAKSLRIAIANAGLVLREEAGGLRLERAAGPDERAQALARLRRPSPTVPAPGPDLIPRGLVVLQGRLLAPPFRVEATPTAVLLNGIAVYPPPGPSQPPPAVSAAQVDAFAQRLAAVRAYGQEQLQLGETAARAACLERMAALPGVRAARWEGEGVLLAMADGSEETVVLVPREREAEPPTAAEIAAQMANQAALLRTVLAQGGSVLAGSTYLLTRGEPGAVALRGRAEAILASTDDEALNLVRLQALLGHRHAAAGLLYAR
jgi:hypothetical protein